MPLKELFQLDVKSPDVIEELAKAKAVDARLAVVIQFEMENGVGQLECGGPFDAVFTVVEDHVRKNGLPHVQPSGLKVFRCLLVSVCL